MTPSDTVTALEYLAAFIAFFHDIQPLFVHSASGSYSSFNPHSSPSPFFQNSTTSLAIFFGLSTLFPGSTTPHTLIKPQCTPVSAKARFRDST